MVLLGIHSYWARLFLFQGFAGAVVFKHGLQQSMQQVPAPQLPKQLPNPFKKDGPNEDKQGDFISDVMQDIVEVTAKNTIDEFEGNFKGGEEKRRHVTENNGKNPLEWLKGLGGNLVGAAEDKLEDKVMKSAQAAFDKQIDRNGDLINPSEEYLHPDPKDRREPQMPGSNWNEDPNPAIPTKATGVFAEPEPQILHPESGMPPEGDIITQATGIFADPAAVGSSRGKGRILPPMMKFIQKSSGEGHLNNVPGYDVPTDTDAVKDVMSDVMADLNDITQLRAYDAAKDAWTKDYDADIAAKNEALHDAKGPLDWLGKFGQAKSAEVADRMQHSVKETAKEEAQTMWDKLISEDGKIQAGGLSDMMGRK